MDGNLWARVYQLVMTVDHPQMGTAVHSDRLIVLVALRAIKDDKSIAWACRPENVVGLRGLETLPSQPTMSRRLRTVRVQTLLKTVEMQLQRPAEATEPMAVDGRPLVVSRYSKDPDADWGYAMKTVGLGYKIHTIWAGGPVPLAWEVQTLRASEATVATERLVPALPQATKRSYLIGDAAYDTNKLYAATAQRGYQLLAPPKHPRRGLGHRPHHPDRMAAMTLLNTPRGQKLMAKRTAIERSFGNWSVRPEGLSELPKHVRRLHRVRLFVHAKIILNGIRILMNRNQLPLTST
jgi:hypothetical protein